MAPRAPLSPSLEWRDRSLDMGDRVMTKHRHFRKNETGAAAAEYALVLAILGAALTFGALALGTAVTDSIEDSECVAGTVAQGVDCR